MDDVRDNGAADVIHRVLYDVTLRRRQRRNDDVSVVKIDVTW